jgi:hypothetical protein
MEQETPRPDRQQHALARARSRADGRHAALQRSVSVASSMSDSSTAEEADEARVRVGVVVVVVGGGRKGGKQRHLQGACVDVLQHATARHARPHATQELLEAGPDKALLLLGRQHIIRRASAALVTHRFFSWFILSMVREPVLRLWCWVLAACAAFVTQWPPAARLPQRVITLHHAAAGR